MQALKAPAFQFYPADWQRDLSEHPLEIEGAWIRICCALWWSDTPGKATKPLTNWARVLRVGERKCLSIINYLLIQKVAEVVIEKDTITISSRRMIRDDYITNIRRNAGSMGGNPAFEKGKPNPYYQGKQDKQKDKQKITPSSSSSSSTTKNKTNTIFIIPTMEQVFGYCKERGKGINAQTFIDHYTSNGWMVGKNKMKDWRAAVRTWESRGGNGKQHAGIKAWLERENEDEKTGQDQIRQSDGSAVRDI